MRFCLLEMRFIRQKKKEQDGSASGELKNAMLQEDLQHELHPTLVFMPPSVRINIYSLRHTHALLPPLKVVLLLVIATAAAAKPCCPSRISSKAACRVMM